MVDDYPKTPLFRIDEERGFCFLARREMHMQKIVVFKLGISQRSQQQRYFSSGCGLLPVQQI